MNIAVCDDEEVGLDYIRGIFSEIRFGSTVEYYNDIDVFMQEVKNGIKYDVVLMDIDWKNEHTGIDYGNWLYVNMPKTKLIFITGYSQQYIEAVFMQYTNIEGYLSKPVDKGKLECLLNKISVGRNKKENEKIVLKVNRGILSLECNQVYYIEAHEHNCIIRANDKEISIYSQLKEIIEQLPHNFFRCHRSYIVNFDHVRRIEDESIVLDCDKEIFISRRNRKRVKDAFFEYVTGKN